MFLGRGVSEEGKGGEGADLRPWLHDFVCGWDGGFMVVVNDVVFARFYGQG